VNVQQKGAAVTSEPAQDPAPPVDHPSFDTSVAHPARIYDYLLGGKDNYAVDRAAGQAAIESYPDAVSAVRANRAFLARAVRYLAAEAGVRQFLDIGTGIPTANNTHEVAQAAAPDCRVVYVDNDPIVLAHARALLVGSPEGATDYLDADLRDTGRILEQAAATLDFSRPVAVVLMAILHLIEDSDDPYGIVGTLTGATPAGSYLALSHIASDIDQQAVAEARERVSRLMPVKQTYRSHAQVTQFFDGMRLVPPGVVPVQEWRSATGEAEARSAAWGGVGRKN
jgi:S-adenosyl methyltransferase